MEYDKKEIAARLKQWLEDSFDSINEGIKALGKNPSSFRSSYLNAKSSPGAELLAKLSEAGCDITWLLTGTRSEDSLILSQVIQRERELKQIEELKEENKHLREELARKLLPYRNVAEKKEEYKRNN